VLCDAPSFEEAFLTGSCETETGALSSTGTVLSKDDGNRGNLPFPLLWSFKVPGLARHP